MSTTNKVAFSIKTNKLDWKIKWHDTMGNGMLCGVFQPGRAWHLFSEGLHLLPHLPDHLTQVFILSL